MNGKKDQKTIDSANQGGKAKKKRGSSALKAASVARSATGAVAAHSGSDLVNSGTSVNYNETPETGESNPVKI